MGDQYDQLSSLGSTDSLRDKLQTLHIFIFILYQMDKPSGICVMSPNTKAIAFTFAWFWSFWFLHGISFYDFSLSLDRVLFEIGEYECFVPYRFSF
jgi:hypothetical protein